MGVVVLVGLTLLGGGIHGRMNRRWGASLDVQRVAEQLREFPTDIGPWHMRESEPLSADVEAMLQCVGYVGRQYENRETGEVVSVALLLGPAGPISVHTPEVCYSSRDYTFRQARTRMKLGPGENPQDELWSTTLQSTRLDASYLRVYYGWSTGGAWRRRRMVVSLSSGSLTCTRFRSPVCCRRWTTKVRRTRP